VVAARRARSCARPRALAASPNPRAVAPKKRLGDSLHERERLGVDVVVRELRMKSESIFASTHGVIECEDEAQPRAWSHIAALEFFHDREEATLDRDARQMAFFGARAKTVREASEVAGEGAKLIRDRAPGAAGTIRRFGKGS
jgi:hypothetical protein